MLWESQRSQTDQEGVIIIKEREQSSRGHNFIPNEIRNFLMKINGTIAHHFDEEKNTSCTFCVIARHLPPQKESGQNTFSYIANCFDTFKLEIILSILYQY